MHISITSDDLTIIRQALAHCGGDPSSLIDSKEADDLLDRLPEPLDELWLGIPNQGRRVWHRWHDPREAAYEAENGGL